MAARRLAPAPAGPSAARACPLCGAGAGGEAFPYRAEWDGRLFRHLRCTGCSTTYVDPAPSAADLGRIYAWGAYHGRHYGEPEPGAHHRSLQLLHAVCPAGGRVLDFGCGRGDFLAAAAAAGYDCHGVEYEDRARAEAHRASGAPVSSLDEVAASGRRFDAVHLRDVVPHLVEPADTVRRLRALLAPGGAFVLDNPLEGNASLVLWAATATKRLRVLLGHQPVSHRPPTMLLRCDAAALRRFFTVRLGLREAHFEVYETGWPYHLPGARPTSAPAAVKQAIGLAAVGLSRLDQRVPKGLGNRALAVYTTDG